MSRIRTGESKFDKTAGKNEQGEVRAVAIWKGAHSATGGWEYTIWSPAPLNSKMPKRAFFNLIGDKNSSCVYCWFDNVKL